MKTLKAQLDFTTLGNLYYFSLPFQIGKDCIFMISIASVLDFIKSVFLF